VNDDSRDSDFSGDFVDSDDNFDFDEAESISGGCCKKLKTDTNFDPSIYEHASAKTPLYHGSSVSLLQAVASQFLWFSSNPGISKESLSYQFSVQKCLLPPDNLLPCNYEEAYAIIQPFLVKSLCFHACPHDCVLFRDSDSFKYSALDKCPKCGSNRFLSSNIPRKHFLYLPLGPRFGRLYGTASLAQVVQSFPIDVKDAIQVGDVMGDIQHSPLWETCRSTCTSMERTVVLQPSTDGMNPFNKNKTSYSMWPITLAMLNLPRKIRYLFGRLLLVGIIPGEYAVLCH